MRFRILLLFSLLVCFTITSIVSVLGLGCSGVSCLSTLDQTGLSRWYVFNDTSSTLLDYSGNSKDLACVNTITIDTPDVYGNVSAYKLNRDNGDNCVDNSSKDIVFDNKFTVAAWVKFDTVNLQQFVISLNASAPFAPSNLLRMNPSSTVVASYINTQQKPTLESNSINLVDWTHYTLKREQYNLSLYINGILNNSRRVNSYAELAVPLGLMIGAIGGATELLDGNIADFSLWERGITEDEIECLGNSSATSSCMLTIDRSSLLRWYVFNDTATYAWDYSGNMKNLTCAGEINVPDPYGGTDAIRFDSESAQYCESVPPAVTSEDLDLISDFTISFWMQVNDSTTTQPAFQFKSKDTYLKVDGTKENIVVKLAEQNVPAITLNSINAEVDTWYHAVVTRSDQNYSMYINGYQNYSILSNLTGEIYGDKGLLIGKQFASENHKFNGTLTDISFWSRAWSQSEIWSVYYGTLLPPSVTIIPKPATDNDVLNTTINFADVGSDTWVYNETKWFNNSIEDIRLRNFTSISKENTTVGDTWVFSARVNDGFQWSNWINDSVVIADTTAPLIQAITVSNSAPTTDETITFIANVTDTQSGINANACKYEIFSSTLSPDRFNLTSNSKTGDLLQKEQSMAAYGAVTLEWQKIYCEDASGNLATNFSVGINVTISNPSTPSTPAAPGGGGTSTIVTEPPINVSDVLLCGNGICQEGENPQNCRVDCFINVETILSGKTLQQAWFIRIALFGFFGLVAFIVFFPQIKQTSLYRRIVSNSKKRRR
ncbi:MAG: LamG-like jellyroll fold domain-containing protein [Nanoarchaeota archaeon]|nr:LamG-like jellyroll fold domain-containing protein [Nanoarchaeota archaeon]